MKLIQLSGIAGAGEKERLAYLIGFNVTARTRLRFDHTVHGAHLNWKFRAKNRAREIFPPIFGRMFSFKMPFTLVSFKWCALVRFVFFYEKQNIF